MFNSSPSPSQLKLPQSISSKQLKRLQSAELGAGQSFNQWLQVSALTTMVSQGHNDILEYGKNFKWLHFMYYGLEGLFFFFSFIHIWLASVHMCLCDCVQIAVVKNLPKPRPRRRWLKPWKSWNFICLPRRNTITNPLHWTPSSMPCAVSNRWQVKCIHINLFYASVSPVFWGLFICLFFDSQEE